MELKESPLTPFMGRFVPFLEFPIKGLFEEFGLFSPS